MEENLIPALPDYKLYKDRSIYVGTLLGGPLVAGYLIAENFKRFEQPEKAKKTWVIAVITTIIIIGLSMFIPNIEQFRYLIPIIYALLAQYLVQHYQGEIIKNHIEKGGKVYSVWRAVLVGIIGLAILFTIIFIILLLTNNEIFN